MKGTTGTLRGCPPRAHIRVLTDRTNRRAQRSPDEKRARVLAAARTLFGETGYGASVHDICRAAGVGIGTFYHQFPDKAEVMHHLMEEEHDHRIRAFDELAGADDPAADIVRVLAGSDPALMRAMVEACGIDARLRDFARELRLETQKRLAAAIARVRQGRGRSRPALDPSTAAWAILALGDAGVDGDAPTEAHRVVNVLAFTEAHEERVRA